MKEPLKMLAFDFGASSGRAMLGILDGKKLTIEQMHRFSNDPVQIGKSFYWDILRLFHEIKQGILKTINSNHKNIASLAIDTWGVDFGLLDGEGKLLGNPYNYRDTRTDGMIDEVFKVMGEDELYNQTGIQIMKINTIFQLFSMKYNKDPLLNDAKTLLFTPDLFNYFLTGVKSTEYSIASTSQLLNGFTGQWSDKILKQLNLPRKIFTDIVPSGTVIGNLTSEIVNELGVPKIPVVATASHDTQAAIAAVPAESEDYVYISCGTWSLMGVETDKPVINEITKDLAFTNEIGVENKICLQKNIMGLWLVQECRRQWIKEGNELSFSELEQMANKAEPFVSFVNPDDNLFVSPNEMPSKIIKYCQDISQPIPQTQGEIIRCIIQSLSMKYRMTVESLEKILDKKLPVIHMVGGGIQDKMLCQFTANATGRRVIAGPIEATAIGNLMVQALALGKIKNLKEAREIVRNSFPVTIYQPENCSAWDKAYEKFKKLM